MHIADVNVYAVESDENAVKVHNRVQANMHTTTTTFHINASTPLNTDIVMHCENKY